MGVTGSGKSQVSFILSGHLRSANRGQQVIDTLTGQSKRAGSDLESCTKVVSANRVLHHGTYGNNLVLVDTPGLDTDFEKVNKWMADT